ncbi:hypothetical protein ABKN59_012028 [Abortiporus biennis]
MSTRVTNEMGIKEPHRGQHAGCGEPTTSYEMWQPPELDCEEIRWRLHGAGLQDVGESFPVIQSASVVYGLFGEGWRPVKLCPGKLSYLAQDTKVPEDQSDAETLLRTIGSFIFDETVDTKWVERRLPQDLIVLAVSRSWPTGPTICLWLKLERKPLEWLGVEGLSSLFLPFLLIPDAVTMTITDNDDTELVKTLGYENLKKLSSRTSAKNAPSGQAPSVVIRWEGRSSAADIPELGACTTEGVRH